MKTLADYERVELGFVPTPVEPLQRLGAALGLRLFAKRDDFTGFGGGGNKVRKLEYLMADALANRADVLITTGGHQSNHARMVAAAARRFGMRAVLVLRGNPPTEYQGNLLLDRLLGAELEFLDPDAYFGEIDPRMQAHARAARDAGEVAYIIPLGCRRHWPKTKIVGISVSRDASWFQERISAMATECAALLGPGESWTPADIWIEDGFVGTAYGVPSPGGNDAIRLAARSEGMLLDPVYTGKAMHGLTALVRRGAIAAGSSVVFLHCGGSPALYPFSKQLAEG